MVNATNASTHNDVSLDALVAEVVDDFRARQETRRKTRRGGIRRPPE